MNYSISWLDDSGLLRISKRSAPRPSIMAERYDATCSSEFYRGYATVLTQIRDEIRTTSSPTDLGQLIDDFDDAVRGVSAGERQNGARFALMNVASYAQNGTVPEFSAALDDEVVCIAHCFLRNQARGL